MIVLDGTGRYTGITGTVNITVTEGFVLPFYTSGKHKGSATKATAVNQWPFTNQS
jgi:hypothetical protein